MGKFAVIGLGKFGTTVANTLYANGSEVIVIDTNEKRIEEIKGQVSAAVHIDSTNEQALKDVGIHEMDAVILAIGNNIAVSVLTSVILKKLGAGNIYAKVDSKLHARILEMLGVHNIVFPEEQIGIQLAHSLMSANIINYYSLSTGHTIIEMRVPHTYTGKTLQQLALPREKGIHIVAIKYDLVTVSEDGDNIVEKRINDMPGANDIINEGDILVLLGSQSKITELINETAGL
ncbi:MAG: potassium transporter [Candidatus Cloacimonadota bacterium]|nr:MAG: potassium transporter [Candidatus Cloacimonadota bacterium]